jgi:hypothetical protein
MRLQCAYNAPIEKRHQAGPQYVSLRLEGAFPEES